MCVRTIRADLTEVHKVVHGLSSVKLEGFFELDYVSRPRAHVWKLKKNRNNPNICPHFFSERVINC